MENLLLALLAGGGICLFFYLFTCFLQRREFTPFVPYVSLFLRAENQAGVIEGIIRYLWFLQYFWDIPLEMVVAVSSSRDQTAEILIRLARVDPALKLAFSFGERDVPQSFCAGEKVYIWDLQEREPWAILPRLSRVLIQGGRT